MKVILTNQQKSMAISKRKRLIQTIQALLSQTGLKKLSQPRSELHIVFIGHPEMTQINENFLGHCGSTDVVTFDYRVQVKEVDPIIKHQEVVGEIFICVDQAIDVARKFGNSISTEIILYLIHGVLHLCGYDDKRFNDRKTMRKEEERILSKLKEKFDFDELFKIIGPDTNNWLGECVTNKEEV